MSLLPREGNSVPIPILQMKTLRPPSDQPRPRSQDGARPPSCRPVFLKATLPLPGQVPEPQFPHLRSEGSPA